MDKHVHVSSQKMPRVQDVAHQGRSFWGVAERSVWVLQVLSQTTKQENVCPTLGARSTPSNSYFPASEHLLSTTPAEEILTRDAKDAWSSEKILTVLAGSMLAVYSVKLLHEWWNETDDGDENTKEDAGDEMLSLIGSKQLAIHKANPLQVHFVFEQVKRLTLKDWFPMHSHIRHGICSGCMIQMCPGTSTPK